MNSIKASMVTYVSAGVLSILSLSYAMEAISIEGKISYNRIASDVLAGGVAYLLSFLLFNKQLTLIRISTVILPVILGSSSWCIYKIVKGMLIDWAFLGNHLEQLYSRHLETG